MNKNSPQVRWYVPIGAIVLGWVLALLAGCSNTVQSLPLVLRPDTRRVVEIEFDSAALSALFAEFQRALPNEAVLCLRGKLSSILHDNKPFLKANVESAERAQLDSVAEFSAWLPLEPKSGCTGKNLLAHAHSHPYAFGPVPCTHSASDAGVLFHDRRLLFSIIVCGNGQREVLFQDGRRYLSG